MVKSDLCDYGDECIVIKGTITVESDNDNNSEKEIKKVTFKSNAPFRSCISKIISTFIDKAITPMPKYNLVEYSDN